MIVQRDGGWCVVSATAKDKDGNPKLLGGPYATRKEAEDRLREIEAFKHMDADFVRALFFVPPEAGDAPDAVKRILAETYNSCRTTWVEGNPGDRENAGNKTSCAKIAWAAVEKAGWKKGTDGKWMKTQTAKEFVDQCLAIVKVIFPFLTLEADPEKAAVQIREAFANGGDIDVEIFSAGTWNGDDYTVADLHDMVKNFDLLKNEIKPPVKLGHNDDGLNTIVTDGQPAYGWVKALKVVGVKLMATITQVPEVLKKAIKAGRYKRVSSEVYWNLKKKTGELYRRVLGAVAFLGSDAPAVTNLADLEALFTRSTGAAASGSFERTRHYTFETEDGEHITHERSRNMALTEAEAQALQDENTRLKANNDELRKSNLSARQKHASTQVKSYCDAQVKAGLMQPSTRDSIMKGIADGKYVYSDEGDGSYAIPFNAFKTVFDLRKPGKGTPAARQTFSEQIGRTDLEEGDNIEDENEEHEYAEAGNRSAGELVDLKVKQYCAKNKVDYSTGLRTVLRTNPKLAMAYVEATPLVKNETEASQAADMDVEG